MQVTMLHSVNQVPDNQWHRTRGANATKMADSRNGGSVKLAGQCGESDGPITYRDVQMGGTDKTCRATIHMVYIHIYAEHTGMEHQL
jgi:hypothetical protein